MEDITNTCAVCHVTAQQKCNGCETTYYCSRQHQKADWKTHVKLCRPFKIAIDPLLGRHYIASRNLRVGEIVIKETQPLVAGPMNASPAVCLSCYTVLQASTAKPCIICGWPLCLNCTQHGSECQFTLSHKNDKVSITMFGLPHPSYNCINVIRALCLKESNPKAYERLLSLESHYDLMNTTDDYKFGAPLLIVDLMKRLFKMEDIPAEEVMKIVGIFQINGHEVPVTDPPHSAVYDLASMVEHNCQANCAKSFTETGGLIIHVATPITKGEHISISYTDSLWGATNRRHHLLRTKFFECTCIRCKDPSELGTMYNAIKCVNKSCTGYMLPKTFQADELDAYKCSRCSHHVPSKQVDEMHEAIGQDLVGMQKNNAIACREFIKRHEGSLHENHFYNTDVNIALAQLIGANTGLHILSEHELDEKINLCKKVDSLLKIIAPAEVRLRGTLCFEIHAVLAEYGRRNKKGAMLELLTEAREYLVDTCKLLQHEPKILPEGKIALRAIKNLEKIDTIFKTFDINSVS